MATQATVTIANNVISVTPDPVPAGNGQNVNIHWSISTDGWTFPSNGIVIANGTGVFSDPEVKDNGKTFKWKDKNDNNLSYKYTINVTNGTTPLSKDPTIQNQGQSIS